MAGVHGGAQIYDNFRSVHDIHLSYTIHYFHDIISLISLFCWNAEDQILRSVKRRMRLGTNSHLDIQGQRPSTSVINTPRLSSGEDI